MPKGAIHWLPSNTFSLMSANSTRHLFAVFIQLNGRNGPKCVKLIVSWDWEAIAEYVGFFFVLDNKYINWKPSLQNKSTSSTVFRNIFKWYLTSTWLFENPELYVPHIYVEKKRQCELMMGQLRTFSVTCSHKSLRNRPVLCWLQLLDRLHWWCKHLSELVFEEARGHKNCPFMLILSETFHSSLQAVQPHMIILRFMHT